MTKNRLVTMVDAHPGDLVEIVGHSVGDAARVGEILEVAETEGRAHFRVRWEDGHESVLYPGTDVVVRRPVRRRRTTA